MRGRNQFDAAITITTCVVTVVVYLPNGFDNPAAVRAMLSLRLLRLLRLLNQIESFQKVAATFVRAAPAASKLFQTLALLMYLFTAVGLQLFGGIITTDDSEAIISREQACELVITRVTVAV